MQAQLTQLRQAQRAWEAERQALLSDVEEERARLQEGLSQALMQASCAQVRAVLCAVCSVGGGSDRQTCDGVTRVAIAMLIAVHSSSARVCCPRPPPQREADVAAERAAHWCSLADLLQQSALLPDGPASPEGSAAASLSATPASRMAGTPASRAPTSVLSSSSAPRSLGRMRGSDAARSAAHLLAEWRPASALRQATRPAAANSHSSVASRAGSPQGPGLLKAFQAVAEERAPSSLEPAEPVAVLQPAEVAAPSAGVCSSADVYATKLRLKRLDTSPPSTGSAGHGPLTPMQHMTLPGAGEAGDRRVAHATLLRLCAAPNLWWGPDWIGTPCWCSSKAATHLN